MRDEATYRIRLGVSIVKMGGLGEVAEVKCSVVAENVEVEEILLVFED